MKIQRTIPGMVMLLILASLLLVSAFPQGNAVAQDLVRLTINNPTSRDVWLKLEGPAVYNLRVNPGESKTFTPESGTYNYILTSCDTTETGVMDLTSNKKIDIATCGVRLTINNNSDRDVWLKLDGNGFYNLHVPAGQSKVYTPKGGIYDYTLHHCGTFVKGELDLTNRETIEVPECGDKAHYGAQDPSFIDEGRMLNLVDVTFENETGYDIMMIIEGPTVHVFSFKAGEDKEYTIPMGYYTYKIYGCTSSVFEGTFFARFHKVKEFTCKTN